MEGQPDSGSAGVHLAPGVDIHVGMSDLDGTVELGLKHKGEVVNSKRIKPEDGPEPFELHLGPLNVEIELGADNSRGVVTAEGKVVIQGDEDDTPRTLIDVGGDLFYYAPSHGSVGGDRDQHPLIYEDPDFGETRASSKNVTRFFVEDRHHWLANVGQVVKNALWDHTGDWVFNTVACVGAFDDAGRGSYSDPTSPWFNVFLGYYQIDAPKRDWSQPFGYKAAKGAASEVDVEEIVRLGKSDWNYFSNWMYGVPGGVAERHNDIDVSQIRFEQSDAGVIGESRWHRLKIDGPRFVSAYEAEGHEAEKLVHNSALSGMWRKAFGIPNPRPDFTESFIATDLQADMYVAYWEDDEAFHTTIFGGTAKSGESPAFLERQMAAANHVIAMNYRDLGFSPT